MYFKNPVYSFSCKSCVILCTASRSETKYLLPLSHCILLSHRIQSYLSLARFFICSSVLAVFLAASLILYSYVFLEQPLYLLPLHFIRTFFGCICFHPSSPYVHTIAAVFVLIYPPTVPLPILLGYFYYEFCLFLSYLLIAKDNFISDDVSWYLSL